MTGAHQISKLNMRKIARLMVRTGQRRIYDPRQHYYWTIQSFKSEGFRRELITFDHVASAPASPLSPQLAAVGAGIAAG
jgi:hypothetical protein